MKFQEYLVERTMNFEKALEVFGISAEDTSDKLALKKKYRTLAMQHHPDHGGDNQMAQDVNDAYAVLKGSKVSSGSRMDWDALGAKYRRWGAQIKNALLSNFKPEVFQAYFKEQSGYDYQYEITKSLPLERDKNPSYAGFDAEFFTKDRSTVFTFKVHATLSDVIHNNSLGHGEDISYNVYTEAHGFHLNKKQKMSKSDWKFTTDHSFFRKPEQLFPKKKMKDIFSGKTSNRAFKKRDMETFLKKKLGADMNNEFAYIPLGEEYFLVIFRSVFMRMGSWGVNGIYQKKGMARSRVHQPRFVSFVEEEETAKIFEKIQKEAKKAKGESKINKTDQLIKQASEAYKKSKGI